MFEQHRNQNQDYQVTRDFSPADQWRAHIVLTKDGGQPIQDRLFDIGQEIPFTSPSLPRVECERIKDDNDSFILRLFMGREFPSQFVTRGDALNRAVALVFNAMHVTGNGDMQVSAVFLQRTSVIEAYEKSPNYSDDAAHLPEKYWLNVTADAQEEFDALEATRHGLGDIETTE